MAKQTLTPEQLPSPPPAARAYTVIGLQCSESMPISFQGRDYDLAQLSDEDLAYLLTFPEQVPYLRAGQTDTSQSNG